jgi:hypothetical protein
VSSVGRFGARLEPKLLNRLEVFKAELFGYGCIWVASNWEGEVELNLSPLLQDLQVLSLCSQY